MLWLNERALIFYFYLDKRKLQVLKLFDIYLTIVLALIILIGMLAPLSGVTTAPAGTDKIIHLVAFAALVFPSALKKRIGLFPLFIFASLFGGITEVLQISFGRNADINDWFANNFGIACGIGIAKIYIRSKTH
jgi:hypothetical protein